MPIKYHSFTDLKQTNDRQTNRQIHDDSIYCASTASRDNYKTVDPMEMPELESDSLTLFNGLGCAYFQNESYS